MFHCNSNYTFSTTSPSSCLCCRNFLCFSFAPCEVQVVAGFLAPTYPPYPYNSYLPQVSRYFFLSEIFFSTLYTFLTICLIYHVYRCTAFILLCTLVPIMFLTVIYILNDNTATNVSVVLCFTSFPCPQLSQDKWHKDIYCIIYNLQLPQANLKLLYKRLIKRCLFLAWYHPHTFSNLTEQLLIVE